MFLTPAQNIHFILNCSRSKKRESGWEVNCIQYVMLFFHYFSLPFVVSTLFVSSIHSQSKDFMTIVALIYLWLLKIFFFALLLAKIKNFLRIRCQNTYWHSSQAPMTIEWSNRHRQISICHAQACVCFISLYFSPVYIRPQLMQFHTNIFPDFMFFVWCGAHIWNWHLCHPHPTHSSNRVNQPASQQM